MSRKKIDMIGREFGMLEVIEDAGYDKHRHVIYKVRCICGNKRTAIGQQLRNGKVTSCGKCSVKKKRCNKCHENKYLSQFSKLHNSPDGVRYTCKSCASVNTYKSTKNMSNLYLDLKYEILITPKTETEKLTNVIYELAGLTQANGHRPEYDELKNMAFNKMGLG